MRLSHQRMGTKATKKTVEMAQTNRREQVGAQVNIRWNEGWTDMSFNAVAAETIAAPGRACNLSGSGVESDEMGRDHQGGEALPQESAGQCLLTHFRGF